MSETQSPNPKEQNEIKTPPKAPEAIKLEEEKEKVRVKYAEDTFAEKPQSLDTREDKKQEIAEMDSILPEAPFPRYDIRKALLEIASVGKVEQKDIPFWVYDEANGENLYGKGWRHTTLQRSIDEWQDFIRQNDN